MNAAEKLFKNIQIINYTIYNSFCIPKATYGIGLEPLNEQLLRKLEIMQNNILRGTLGLHKTAKMSALKRT